MNEAMDVKNIILLTYVGTGLLLAAIAVPLAMDKIKPNFWYGFRTPRTLKDPEVWYKVNHFAGQRLIIAGLLTVFSTLAMYFVLPASSMELFIFGTLAIMIGTLMWAVGTSFYFLSKL